MIHGHTGAVEQRDGVFDLGVGVTRAGGRGEEPARLLDVHLHAAAFLVERRQRVLGLRVAGVGRHLHELGGAAEVLRQQLAFEVEEREIVSCDHVTELGCFAQQLRAFVAVGRAGPAGQAKHRQCEHRLAVAARCGELRVRVLRTGLAWPVEDERRLVGLARKRRAWAREVLLVADGQPVVFAHTVLAPRHLRGPWRMAAGIGGRPLGAALFAQPRIVRGPLHCQRLTSAHPLHRRAEIALGRKLPVLWGRRSRFLRGGTPLLVTEVFLPEIARLG